MKPALESPRWPKGPFICRMANLPALKTEKELFAFHAANGPRCEIIEVYLCPFCDHLHMTTSAPDPSGSTSGNTRRQKGK